MKARVRLTLVDSKTGPGMSFLGRETVLARQIMKQISPNIVFTE